MLSFSHLARTGDAQTTCLPPADFTLAPPSYVEEIGHEHITELDRVIYHAIASYAFDEPECWPSQQRIADDLGCRRESVNRAVQRLVKAGWLVIKEKRRDGARGWLHNVYELLHEFHVSQLATRRLSERGKRRKHRRRAARSFYHPVSVSDPDIDVAPAGFWCTLTRFLGPGTRPPPVLWR